MSEKAKSVVLSIVSIVIVAVSLFFNLGFIRFFLTFFFILPLIHTVAFFFLNLFFSNFTGKSPKLRILNYFYTITYLLLYLFLPDSNEISTYFFFGLIHGDAFCNIAHVVSAISLFAHIVLLILQVFEVKKLEKKIMGAQ